jgi:methylenetetrahydrofolate dehydrogenase (NADP+)/methenyltetrahydrofolate cyclohydrolase
MIIDGNAIADKIIAELKAQNKSLGNKKVYGILVGDNEASLSFLRQKSRTARALGLSFVIKKLKPRASAEELAQKVAEISGAEDVLGVIVQLPIPDYKSEDTSRVLDSVPYEKDIDCLGDRRSQEFYADPIGTPIAPPAVGTVAAIIRELGVKDVAGKKAVVYGHGRLVGKPIAAWLRAHGAEVFVLRTASTPEERVTALKSADIIVTGVGKPEEVHITGEMIKPGAIVIDFGYPADCDAASIDASGSIVTPTPFGTGPILVAELFRNLFKLYS